MPSTTMSSFKHMWVTKSQSTRTMATLLNVSHKATAIRFCQTPNRILITSSLPRALWVLLISHRKSWLTNSIHTYRQAWMNGLSRYKKIRGWNKDSKKHFPFCTESRQFLMIVESMHSLTLKTSKNSEAPSFHCIHIYLTLLLPYKPHWAHARSHGQL